MYDYTTAITDAELPFSLGPRARRIGVMLARRLFAARGNHTEAHLTEYELACALATAAHIADPEDGS